MKNLTNLPIIVLSTYGHCAADWLGNLFDSHNEVLIAPPLSFFRKINKIEKYEKINLSILSNKKLIKLIVSKILKKSNFKSYNYFNGKKEEKKFEIFLNNYFTRTKEKIIKRKIFYGIYYSYAKLKKINLEKIKIIITHEHASWHCENYKKIFNAKFLFIVRDPRATFAGSLRTFDRYANFSNSYKLNIILSFWISAERFISSNLNKNLYVIKNEKINKNTKLEMKKLCKWLNIDFENILLKPTFLGKKWHGDSSYLGKFELNKELPKNYYSPDNVKRRWINYLDNKTILLIETLFEKTMQKYDYKLNNNLTLLNKLRGYLYLFLLYQDKKNRFNLLPSLIKNTVKRALLLKFSFYVK